MDQPPPLTPQPPPPSNQIKPDKPRSKHFKLHPVSIVFMVIGIILAAIGGYQGSTAARMEGPEMFGYYVSTFLAAIGLPLLLSWLAWLLSRRRLWAGNFVFCLLAGFMGLGSINTLVTPKLRGNAQAVELQRQVQELKEANQADAPIHQRLEKIDNLATSMEAYSETARDEKEAANARVAAEFMRQTKEKIGAFGKAQEAFMSDEVSLVTADYTSSEQLQNARDITRSYEQASANVLDFYDNLEAHVISIGREKGMPPQQARELSHKFIEEIGSKRLALIHRIYQTNMEYAQTIDKFLKLLQDEWGKWEYDPDDDTVYFDNDDTLAAYNQMLERLIWLEDKIAENEQAAHAR